jgi:DNA-binding transcriptional regulator YhcF (GntR family)
MKNRKAPVLSETLKKLRTIIQGLSNARLPSVRTLAQRCAVSPVTILRAIAILKGEGLLESDWGRGNYITAKKASLKLIDDHQSMTTVEKTLLMIKNDIIEGKYQTHHPLPTIKNLTAQYDVSYPTLKKALALLIEESIIKRSGVRYHFFTGKAKPKSIIAVVAFGLGRNSIKIETERERNFYHLLSTVVTDHNVILETICCNDYLEETQFYTPDDTPLANYLKNKNITGLILSSYHMKDSAECLRRLLIFNIPISAWVEDHRILKMIGRCNADRKKLSFFDTSYSMIPGFEVGRYLIEKGHKNIGYFSPFHESPWSQNRLNGLKKAAASSQGVEIFPFVCTGYLNDYFFLEKVLKESSFDEHCAISKISDKVYPFLKYRISSIRYEHDLLLRDNMIFSICEEFMKEASKIRTISAYVCANDHIAVLINDYWDHCAIPLAERPALVGFDNSFESFRRNISSYEFNTHGEILQMLNHLLYPNSSYQLNRKPAIRLSGRVVERT